MWPVKHLANSDIGSPEIVRVFAAYPEGVQQKLLTLRQWVKDTAAQMPEVGELQESLKWGEPSYCVQGGSPVRLGWKPARPDQYALHFHCQTCLVETFKELYGDRLCFDGKRAIVFNVQDEVSPLVLEAELRHCIALALRYHTIKHLPLLGA